MACWHFEARAPRFEGAVTLAAPPGQKGEGNDRSRGASPRRSRPILGGAARTDRGELRRRGARAETCRQRRCPFRRVAAAARGAVGAPARCRQVLSPRTTCRRAGSRVAGVAGADVGRSAAADRRRRSNSPPSRSCWADVRCRTSPPSCMATANPGAVDRLEFRAPGATRVSLSEAGAQERCARTSSRPRSTSNPPIPTR